MQAVQSASRFLDLSLNIPRQLDTRMEVCMNIHRNGKTSHLMIITGSGVPQVDAAILKIFTSAGNNFPPLPPGIKEEPFLYHCTVALNIPAGPHKFNLRPH
jgi:hypothetical protein